MAGQKQNLGGLKSILILYEENDSKEWADYIQENFNECKHLFTTEVMDLRTNIDEIGTLSSRFSMVLLIVSNEMLNTMRSVANILNPSLQNASCVSVIKLYLEQNEYIKVIQSYDNIQHWIEFRIADDDEEKVHMLFSEIIDILEYLKVHQIPTSRAPYQKKNRKSIVTVSGLSFKKLKEILSATRTSAKRVILNFDDPSEGTWHTLTTDIVNILTEHAHTQHDNKQMQTILLNNVSFGQKIVQCSISTDDLVKVKLVLAEEYTTRLACLHLLAPHLEELDLGQPDAINEADEFAKLIILDYVCYSLVSRHENIVEAYPSPTNDKNDSIILIAFTKVSTNIEQFRSFRVLCTPYLANTSESISAENYAQEKDLHCSSSQDLKILTEVIESNTDTLFSKHSNLEGIGSSMVRSTRKGYDTASPCVVLYCRCKSYIPYGEKLFPDSLSHQKSISFKTDVRQGYFQFGPNGKTLTGTAKDWHKELAMGCSVGPNSGHYDATLGPFLHVEGISETCFLTVRHMFQPFDIADCRLQGLKVMQPADGDTRQNPYLQTRQRNQEEDRECGEILTSIFNEFVDVAVVKIKSDRSPSRGLFVVPTENELKLAGFSYANFPIFDDGSALDVKSITTENYATERIIKIGKATGLTKGSFELYGMAVRVEDEEALGIQYNGRLAKKVMKKQIKVNSHSLKTFFQLGDSGSAVFLVDKQNKLHCIGMAIGAMSDLSCLVTPIQTITSELERKLQRKIVLKNFELEEMQ